MNNQSYSLGVGKPFIAYPKGDFDIESGTFKKGRRRKISLSAMFRIFRDHVYHFIKLRPITATFSILLFLAATFIIGISVFKSQSRIEGSLSSYNNLDVKTPGSYPFQKLRNLVMVAGHSIYTSNSCGKVDQENSWFLESYQKHPGQAATFIAHIQEGVAIADRDDDALLLFSGGETRKDAGPKSEAQSYWGVAESKGWFGKEESVRHRALTEEHARDSFENLLFSICRFRELTGVYPQNVTVVSYDFKEERFAHLHRAAIGFPETKFLYIGTPASSTARDAAVEGEAAVRALFQEDPFGCTSSLHWKKLGRDPFHRTIPYPNGCPELKGLFSYCGTVPYQGKLPWNH